MFAGHLLFSSAAALAPVVYTNTLAGYLTAGTHSNLGLTATVDVDGYLTINGTATGNCNIKYTQGVEVNSTRPAAWDANPVIYSGNAELTLRVSVLSGSLTVPLTGACNVTTRYSCANIFLNCMIGDENYLQEGTPTSGVKMGVVYVRGGTVFQDLKLSIRLLAPSRGAHIIGVRRTATGGGAGTWESIDASGTAITTPDAAYFGAHPVFGGIEDVTIDGQSMVRIPRYYIKNTGSTAYWLSDVPADGFRIHPAFMNYGNEVDCFYIGKYQGTTQTVSSVSKLCSLASGGTSFTSCSASSVRTWASNRNSGDVSGFMMMSIYQWSAIQLLGLIEKATPADSAFANASYRGITQLFGLYYIWCDGAGLLSNNRYRLWDNQGNRTWVDTETQQPSQGSGYYYFFDVLSNSGNLFNFGDVFLPGVAMGTSSASNGTYAASFYAWRGSTTLLTVAGRSGIDNGLFYFGLDRDEYSSMYNQCARLTKY